jgi:uncharacterized phage-like protein YoqJ
MTAAGLPSADMAVYMINCIYNVQNILGLYEFTDQRLEALSTQCESHISALVREQVSYVLSKSGLGFAHLAVQGNHQSKV